jgi:acetyl esterase/lipase
VNIPEAVQQFLDGLRAYVEEAHWPVMTHRYGPHSEQVADLRLPERDGPHPVAVVVHGGFWRAPYTRVTTAALAIDLARRGYATWNIEYRRVGIDGGFPATLEDVEAAVAALETVDAPLDRARVLVIGHSAGGHLALWLAGTGRVTAAVSLAGVSELAEAARREIGERAALEFMGGGPDELPSAYAAADPAARLPTGVPQLLVHGDADDRVPIELSRDYAERARAAGDRVELLELPGVNHFVPIDPRGEAWAATAERLGSL